MQTWIFPVPQFLQNHSPECCWLPWQINPTLPTCLVVSLQSLPFLLLNKSLLLRLVEKENVWLSPSRIFRRNAKSRSLMTLLPCLLQPVLILSVLINLFISDPASAYMPVYFYTYIHIQTVILVCIFTLICTYITGDITLLICHTHISYRIQTDMILIQTHMNDVIWVHMYLYALISVCIPFY